MYKFKTLWCPVGVQHDWQACVYAHNYQDARRQVTIGYGPRPCPYWAKKDGSADYAQRCPLGLRCPFSHGAKEQLYHPQYFRTVICRDLRAKACPRMKLCAFFHRRAERRKPPTDNTDYSMPLPEELLPKDWVTDFLAPPFRDSALTGAEEDTGGAAANFMASEESSMPTLGNGEALDIGANQVFWAATTAAAYAAMAELNPFMHKQLGYEDFAQIMALSEMRNAAATLVPFDSRSTEWDGSTASSRTRTHTGENSELNDDVTTTSSHAVQRTDIAAMPAWTSPVGVAAIGSERTTKEKEVDWSPWKVEVPKYSAFGPLGGAFDGFPGLFANIKAATGPAAKSPTIVGGPSALGVTNASRAFPVGSPIRLQMRGSRQSHAGC